MQKQHQFFILVVMCLFHVSVSADTLNLPVNAQPILVNNGQPIDADLSNTDVNLFVFYADAGSLNTIQIPDASVGNSFNPQIEIFLEDGSPLFDGTFDFGFEGEGEVLDLSPLPSTGFYYIRVTDVFAEIGADRRYQILVFEPTAPQGGNVMGKVLDVCTNQPISGAKIIVLTRLTMSHTTGEYLIARLNPGDYVFSVSANGYQTTNFPVTLQELQALSKDFALQPDQGCTTPPIYDVQQGILQLNNVQAGVKNYQVTLKNIGINGDILLQVINSDLLAISNSTVVASYDFNSLVLTVPFVSVLGLNYSVSLIHSGDFVFRLNSVELLN